MRFVIATLPDVKFNLGRDLSLVKAASLYADEAILFSPTYVGTLPFLDFSHQTLLHQLIYLALLHRDPGFTVGEELSERERVERVQVAKEKSAALIVKATAVLDHLTRDDSSDDAGSALEQIALETLPLSQAVERAWSDDKDYVQRAKEITQAHRLGLISIAQVSDMSTLPYFSLDQLKTDVFTELSRSQSYGALDERFIGEPDELPSGVTQKIRIAKIATDVFSRLPNFSMASFDEIKDIRVELQPHLALFRKAITDISVDIKSSPWDADFPHDVEREVQQRVDPAISEIEAQINATSYLRELVYGAAKNPFAVPATSALGLLVSSSTGVSALAAQVASALTGAALLAFEAHKEWRESRRKTEGNEFYFYYRALQLLKD